MNQWGTMTTRNKIVYSTTGLIVLFLAVTAIVSINAGNVVIGVGVDHPYFKAIIADKPAVYLRLNSAEGEPILNSVVSGQLATVGNFSKSDFNQVSPLTSDENAAALEFSGSDSYVSVPNSSALNKPTTRLTLEIWVYTTAKKSDLALMDRAGSYHLHMNVTGQAEGVVCLSFEGSAKAAGWTCSAPATPINNGKWHLVQAMVDLAENQLQILIDNTGQEVSHLSHSTGTELGATQIPSDTSPLIIGAVLSPKAVANNEFVGKLSEAAVYPTYLGNTNAAVHFYSGGATPAVGQSAKVGVHTDALSATKLATDPFQSAAGGTYCLGKYDCHCFANTFQAKTGGRILSCIGNIAANSCYGHTVNVADDPDNSAKECIVDPQQPENVCCYPKPDANSCPNFGGDPQPDASGNYPVATPAVCAKVVCGAHYEPKNPPVELGAGQPADTFQSELDKCTNNSDSKSSCDSCCDSATSAEAAGVYTILKRPGCKEPGSVNTICDMGQSCNNACAARFGGSPEKSQSSYCLASIPSCAFKNPANGKYYLALTSTFYGTCTNQYDQSTYKGNATAQLNCDPSTSKASCSGSGSWSVTEGNGTVYPGTYSSEKVCNGSYLFYLCGGNSVGGGTFDQQTPITSKYSREVHTEFSVNK
jgi:hypothetical protein